MWTPEHLTRQQIELRSLELLIWPLIEKVGKTHLIRNGIRFDELYKRVIYPRFGIDIHEGACLDELCDGQGALGAFSPEQNLVEIDRRLAKGFGDPRRTFTLHHEVCGHGVLQGRRLRLQARFPDRHPPLTDNDTTMHLRNQDTLEWQANVMAAYTAAPSWLVDMQLVSRLETRGRPLVYSGPSTYWFGPRGQVRPFEVGSFTDYAYALAAVLQPAFDGLSAQALGYRIQRSRIVHDVTRRHHVLLRAG